MNIVWTLVAKIVKLLLHVNWLTPPHKVSKFLYWFEPEIHEKNIFPTKYTQPIPTKNMKISYHSWYHTILTWNTEFRVLLLLLLLFLSFCLFLIIFHFYWFVFFLSNSDPLPDHQTLAKISPDPGTGPSKVRRSGCFIGLC